MAHYHPRFQFPGGLNAFREQKAKAFEKHQNLAVAARDVQIQVQGNQARITFTQDFKSDQLADLGKKTLRMERDDGRWKIKSETWKKMNAR
jgi:hypothetical protein